MFYHSSDIKTIRNNSKFVVYDLFAYIDILAYPELMHGLQIKQQKLSLFWKCCFIGICFFSEQIILFRSRYATKSFIMMWPSIIMCLPQMYQQQMMNF